MNKKTTSLLLFGLVVAAYFAGRHDAAQPRTIVVDREAGTISLVDSDAGAQTISRLDGQPTQLYYDFAALIPAFRPDAKHVMMLGVGGGEMFKVLRRAGFKGSLTGVDRSEDTEATLRAFGLKDVLVFRSDALAFVDRFEAPFGYEGIIVDLYDGPKMSVEQASSAFYYRIAHGLLAPRGVVIVNVAHQEDIGPVATAMRNGGLLDVYAMKADSNTILLGMVKDDWGGVAIPLALSASVDHRWLP